MTARFLPRRVLVTGGAGFIGSAVVRMLVDVPSLERIVVIDALTYAGHRINLTEVESDPRYVFVHGDICDRALVERLFAEHDFDAVLHLAAESHVDRSIANADVFVRTNINGTFVVLDVAWRAFEAREAAARFVHVSTDEVYGSLGSEGRFTEQSAYAPSSPYAASKAASDHLVRSYGKTHGMPVVITNTCNNFGPRQLPEKLVPLMITHAAANEPLPVYGDGKQVREWIHVADHADAIWTALTKGSLGESYNFGTGVELTNKALVEKIADLVDDALGRPQGTSRKLMTFVSDRKGHDFRYALDSSKAQRALGFQPTRSFDDELRATVRWYLDNAEWCRAVMR